jgi:hypothetical protein
MGDISQIRLACFTSFLDASVKKGRKQSGDRGDTAIILFGNYLSAFTKQPLFAIFKVYS